MGIVITVYLRFVKGSSSLFVVAAAFLVAEVGQRIDLDPLLVALAAGVFIRNVTRRASPTSGRDRNLLTPVYVVFFAVAGATVHIHELLSWVSGRHHCRHRAGLPTLGWLSTTIAKAVKTCANISVSDYAPGRPCTGAGDAVR